jgi:outer membrane protein TolC
MKRIWMVPALFALLVAPLGCQTVNRGLPGAAVRDLVSGRPTRPAEVVEVMAVLLPPAEGVVYRASPPPPAEEPIDLARALALGGADNPTIALAREAVRASLARQLEAQALLLPTLSAGASYDWHRGNLQTGQGVILDVERQSAYVGAGAVAIGAGTVVNPGISLVANPADAILAPRAARSAVAARQFDAQAVNNNILLDVATRYFDLVGAEARLLAMRRSEADAGDLVKVTRDMAEAKQGREADAERARTEALFMRAAAERLQGEVDVAAAALARLLNLDPVRLLRAPAAPIPLLELVDPRAGLESLVEIAVDNRPEIAARTADIAVVETNLRQERIRPWVPTLAAGFSAGGFGGGGNLAETQFSSFRGRTDFDFSAIWTFENFGFGNLAKRRRLEARVSEANAERLRAVDAVREEVAEAFALVLARRQTIDIARQRTETAERAFLQDLKRARNLEGRPIEALDSVRLLTRARQDYVGALIGYDQAQLQLFVALGQPPTEALALPCGKAP